MEVIKFRKMRNLFILAVAIAMTTSLSSSISANSAVNNPSDCVESARNRTLDRASAAGEDPNGENFMLYLSYYQAWYSIYMS